MFLVYYFERIKKIKIMKYSFCYNIKQLSICTKDTEGEQYPYSNKLTNAIETTIKFVFLGTPF